ncbi:MAG: hypothetical protein KGL11_13745 [Alphaproteobacteria bacterium]|nr:hypothetical protein [Alphaproteobacteria bacterium]
MKLRRETARKRTAEPPAMRLGLKPPDGGRIKWIRVGFAWDLFVLSPLLGLPLFWRKLHAWGAIVLAILLAWFVADRFLAGRIEMIAGIGFAGVFFLLDLFLGWRGNRLTAHAYLRHGWTVDHPDYAATRKLMARWKLDD